MEADRHPRRFGVYEFNRLSLSIFTQALCSQRDPERNGDIISALWEQKHPQSATQQEGCRIPCVRKNFVGAQRDPELGTPVGATILRAPFHPELPGLEALPRGGELGSEWEWSSKNDFKSHQDYHREIVRPVTAPL